MADEFIARHLRYFLDALGCIVFMALMCKVGLIWTQITGTKNDLKKMVPHKLLHFIIPGSQTNYLVLKVPQKFLPLPLFCVSWAFACVSNIYDFFVLQKWKWCLSCLARKWTSVILKMLNHRLLVMRVKDEIEFGAELSAFPLSFFGCCVPHESLTLWQTWVVYFLVLWSWVN